MRNRVFTALGVAAVAAACTTGTGPANGPTASLSFTTRPGGAPMLSSVAALDDTIISGNDVLIITKAQIVLREIELKLANDDACDSTGVTGDDDGCEEFETGAMLVDLPLNGQVSTEITVAIPPGTYGELDFEVHKPEDDSAADSAFLAQHPTFKGVSIRVEGTFNGTPFVYESDLDVEQENELATPIVVTDSTTAVNVTMAVDLGSWFLDGSDLVDPASANHGGQNESVVKENIKRSFRSFEDEDRDGDDSDEG
jgi:hypothetical protein